MKHRSQDVRAGRAKRSGNKSIINTHRAFFCPLLIQSPVLKQDVLDGQKPSYLELLLWVALLSGNSFDSRQCVRETQVAASTDGPSTETVAAYCIIKTHTNTHRRQPWGKAVLETTGMEELTYITAAELTRAYRDATQAPQIITCSNTQRHSYANTNWTCRWKIIDPNSLQIQTHVWRTSIKWAHSSSLTWSCLRGA